MKNLNDLLTGRDAAQHFLAQRLFFDPRDEILRDLEINIRLQQREAHLPHGIVDIRFADRAMPAQILENILKLIAELRKHNECGTRPAVDSSSSAATAAAVATAEQPAAGGWSAGTRVFIDVKGPMRLHFLAARFRADE